MMARKKKDNEDDAVNPIEPLLRMDRMPHIWCPACGIGTTVNCFARALEDTKTDLDKTCVISGIGCTGRVAGYMNLDSFHTTHGRPIPFATGLKLANPELNVVVYSGDGDLIAIGGNHLIHAARRNVDMLVICVNNYTYGMTGGQLTPTTPYSAVASTAPYGNFEKTFSLPYLADSDGVAAHEVLLQLLDLLRRDAGRRQLAEAGRDSVDDALLLDDPLDDRGRPRQSLARDAAEFQRGTLTSDGDDVLDAKRRFTCDEGAHGAVSRGRPRRARRAKRSPRPSGRRRSPPPPRS